MDKNEPNAEKENGKQASNIAKFAGVGFQMIFIIGIFSFAGNKIDVAAGHHTKWVTAALSLTGVFISLYVVIRSVKS